MEKLDHKEGWVAKNWCFQTVVSEKTLESPLDCKEIQPVHPKGDQSWIFTGRTDAESDATILWPPDVKSWLTGKDPDAGKDRGQEEKGTTEDEMVGQHHQLNRHEFEEIPGDSEWQWSLACCSSWGHEESDTTEQLKNNNFFLLWFSPAWSSQRTVKEYKWDLHEGSWTRCPIHLSPSLLNTWPELEEHIEHSPKPRGHRGSSSVCWQV